MRSASALFHAGVSLVVLFGFMLAVHGAIPLTALLLPLVIAPYCLMILGIAWFLAALGVYFRDISQVLGTLVTRADVPVAHLLSAVRPAGVDPALAGCLNPSALPVEQARERADLGRDARLRRRSRSMPRPHSPSAALGYCWFQKTRKGFADVL